MSAYEHVVVVMSILLGMALTNLLRGIAQLYRARERRDSYWLHWAWIANLGFLSLVLWWTYWGYRGIADWDFFKFVVYLCPTIVFYFLTSIAFPEPGDPVRDLKAFYFANRVGFFGVFALYGVMAGVTAVVVRGLPVLDPSNGFRLLMVALLLIAMRSASARVHTTVVALSAALLVTFVVLFHLRLS